MYYLKYRPETIEQIDNSNVRDTIKTLLQTENIPHALLLTGPKGTGKTSIARIIARSMNEMKEGESIAQSSDIIEMDAASNRGIDEVRNLIKEASYLPMSGKYRIFIVDEAHMITNDAFNALLKTLEEPPETAVFILATTNPEKLPKTIISRCSVINFGRAKHSDIVHMLQRIANAEKLEVSDKLLELVAEHADNSFRDASKILEQLVIQKKLDVEEARGFLGVYGERKLLTLLEQNAPKEALAWLEEFTAQGGNVKTTIEQALEDLRLLLLDKSGVKQKEAPDSNLTLAQISALIRLMTEAHQALRAIPIESLALEIAIVDFFTEQKNTKA